MRKRNLPIEYNDSLKKNLDLLTQAYSDGFKEACKNRRISLNEHLSKENLNIIYLQLGFLLNQNQLNELYLFSSFDNKFKNIVGKIQKEGLKLPKIQSKTIRY